MEEEEDKEEIKLMGATLYCHLGDPHSMKLLLFVLEAKLLPRFREIIEVSKHNEKETQDMLLTKYSISCDRKDKVKCDFGIFPTLLCAHNQTLISGSDGIIHALIDDARLHDRINWKSLTVFNFYSCGMLMELENYRMENKRSKEDLSHYEQLQKDYCALQNQIRPNVLGGLFYAEDKGNGNKFKKLHLEHQAVTCQLNRCLDENKRFIKKIDQLEEVVYGLKNDNIDLLKEKSELRAIHQEEIDCIQEESRLKTEQLTRQSVREVEDLKSTISELKSLIADKINDNVFADLSKVKSDHKIESGSDVDELKNLLEVSSLIPDLRKTVHESNEKITRLTEENRHLHAKLDRIEASLRE